MAADDQASDANSGEASAVVSDEASYQEHVSKGLPADSVCDRCGAHAHLHVLLSSGRSLLFCSHHTGEHLAMLRALPNVVIDDYRPHLRAQERAAHSGARF